MNAKPRAVLRGSDYKNEVISGMNWRTKSRSGCGVSNGSKSDVSISLGKKTKEAEPSLLCVTFRNEVEKLIFDESCEYIQFGIHKNRMFFRQSDPSTGYKMYARLKNCKNRYTKFPIEEESDKNFVGNYELKYDEFLELYYIEKELNNGN